MKRCHQAILVISTLAFSWLAMQAVHELGHVVGAAISGGRVAEVVLHPTTISYTRLAENPHPLFVTWMGPAVGVALPLGAWAVARRARLPGWYIVQFFAGFCSIANGAYIAFGSIESIGDAGDLVRHGSPLLLLWVFGLTTIAFGLWSWNGLSVYFGVGRRDFKVNRSAAYTMLALTVVTLATELVFAN